MSNTDHPEANRAALRTLRRLLSLEPGHRGRRAELARRLAADAQVAEAVDTWVELARDLVTDGEFAAAGAAAREALTLAPNAVAALSLLAAVRAADVRNPGVTSVMSAEAAAIADLPSAVDAMALVRVQSADEVGAELASQSTVDLSLSVASLDAWHDELHTQSRAVEPLAPSQSPAMPPPLAPAPEPMGREASATPRGDSAPALFLPPAAPTSGVDGLPPLPLFAALPRVALDAVIERAALRHFGSGVDVLCPGDPPDALSVVVGGAVRLSLAGAAQPGPGDADLGVLARGGFFGEIEVVDATQTPCRAVAVGDTRILQIDARTVEFLRSHYPGFERRLIEAADRARVVRVLAASALLGGLPSRERAETATLFRTFLLGPGEALVRRGEPPEGLYLVIRGRLTTAEQDEGSWELGPGAFLGVAAMVDRRAVRRDVVALTESVCVCLDRTHVERLLSHWPTLRAPFRRAARLVHQDV
jgi:CRP-like cAMP-binding protein